MRARPALLAVALAALPGVASAHLLVTGMGPLYDGVAHFTLSPEDILPAAALALLAGLIGPAAARRGLVALPAAWIAGGLVAMAGLAIAPLAATVATALLLLALGGLLAANAKLPPAAAAAAAIVVGLLRGAADLAGVSVSPSHLATLVGMGACAFAGFALVASVSLPLTRLWAVVAVRVAGSWMAALGLLLVGWAWRYGARIT